MRLVPDCAAELLGADDCAFAVAVASVVYGAEVPPPTANAQQQAPVPPNPLPPLDLEKWGAERLGRKDREVFAGRVLSFIQVICVCRMPWRWGVGREACGSSGTYGSVSGASWVFHGVCRAFFLQQPWCPSPPPVLPPYCVHHHHSTPCGPITGVCLTIFLPL